MERTELKIRLYGDPVLRKMAKPVHKITQFHRDSLSQMVRLMYENSGVGLAAPQVGISESMIVVDVNTGLYKLINPKITKKEGSQKLEEGCLSIPDIRIKLKRAKKILLEALDEQGRPVSLEARDLLACVFQHEIDHLSGKLIVDRLSFLKKIKIAKKLEELKRKVKSERRAF
jgi:peptide deformylase